MTNEFGAVLDRAGYAPSIMQMNPRGQAGCCYLCGRAAGYRKLDRHEPWGGANRSKSMELGLWILLCHEGCHEGPGSVHGGNSEAARVLRADAQQAAMIRYGWSRTEWISRFGKSEISDAEAERLTVVSRAVKAAAEHAPVFVDGADPSQALSAGSPQGAGQETEDRRGAGGRRTAGDIIRDLWPEHPTTTRRSSFRILDVPELPF